MRITDKRNGEPVGRVLAHPLQREFERSLTRVLGSQENWKVGDRISMDEFNNVQNKDFVRSRLESLGFVVGNVVSVYIYTGTGFRSQAVKTETPIIKLNPKRRYGVAELRRLLEHGVKFTTDGLPVNSKRRITQAIYEIRHNEKMPVLSERVRNGVTTTAVIYSRL